MLRLNKKTLRELARWYFRTSSDIAEQFCEIIKQITGGLGGLFRVGRKSELGTRQVLWMKQSYDTYKTKQSSGGERTVLQLVGGRDGRSFSEFPYIFIIRFSEKVLKCILV